MKKLIRTVAGMGMAFLVGITAVGLMTPSEPASTHSDIPTYVQLLMSTGNCWTGGTGHPLPNQVIVSDRDGNADLLTDDKSVGKAIDQVMGGTKSFAYVNGFCKE